MLKLFYVLVVLFTNIVLHLMNTLFDGPKTLGQ